MALPKLDTASLAPRPPPTLLERLKSLDLKLNPYGPVLGNLFLFILCTSVGAFIMVAVVTASLCGIGFALFMLVQGAKVAMS